MANDITKLLYPTSWLSESPIPGGLPGQVSCFSSTRPTRFMLDDSTIYALYCNWASSHCGCARIVRPVPGVFFERQPQTTRLTTLSRYTKVSAQTTLPNCAMQSSTSNDPTQPRQIQLLDAGALVLYFPPPRTATGEDILELHIHGGPAITKAVLSAIAQTNTLSKQCTTPNQANSPAAP